MKWARSIIVSAIILVLIIISLRRVLFTPGLVGFTWDWAFPPYPEQVLDVANWTFTLWHDIVSLGYHISTWITLYFWFIWSIPALFSISGEYIIKIYLVFFLLLAGINTLFLTRRLGFDWSISFLCAVFYMFSPPFYSRIIAGHLNMVMGYALIPLFIGILIGCLEDKGRWFKKAVLAGIVFSLMVTHESLGVVSMLLLVIFAAMGLRAERRLRGMYIGAIVLAIFILLHSWWLVAFVRANLGTGVQFRGGMTIEEILTPVLNSIKHGGISIWNAIRGYSQYPGQGTEYVFPPPSYLRWLWHATSFILPGFIIIGLIAKGVKGQFNRWMLSFLIVLLFGICLCNGMNNPVGYICYTLMSRFPPILAVFTRVFRFGVLINLGYAVLLGYAIEGYKDWFSRHVRVAAVGLVLIYTLPFLSGRITVPLTEDSQPLCLKINKISPDDKKVYDFLGKDLEDYRVSYLPPSARSYMAETSHAFEWMYIYSPKPEFIGQSGSDKYYNLFMSACLFHPGLVSTELSKLFGLVNVKYLIFPHYKEYFTYDTYGYLPHAKLTGTLYEATGTIEKVLEDQRGFRLNSDLINSTEIKIYENKDYLPHIYPVSDIVLSSGDFGSLIGLSYYPNFSFANNALFYSSSLNSSQHNFLKDLLSTYLIYNNNVIDLILPYLSSESIIYPGYHCKGFYNKWFGLIQWWSEDWHYATAIVKTEGAQTRSEGDLIIKYRAPYKNKYSIYSLIHFGPKGSILTFSLDGTKFKPVYTEVSFDLGFQWIYIGDMDLDEGDHNLIVNAKAGDNAILKIFIAPEKDISNALIKLEDRIKISNLLLLNEAEDIAIDTSDNGYISKSWVYYHLNPAQGLIDLYAQEGIQISSTEKCIMPNDYKSKGSIIYKIEFPFQAEEIRLESWPRIQNDPEKQNYIKAFYSVDNENFVPLYELSSNGDNKWQDIYGIKKENDIKINTAKIFVKFELNNYAQLWAEENHPMKLIAKKGADNDVILHSDKNCSNGRSVVLPINVKMDIPVDGIYNMSIRAKFEKNAEIYFTYNGLSLKYKIEGSDEYSWYNMGNIKLQKGAQRIGIRADQKGYLDLIILKIDNNSPNILTKPSKFECKKINPTKYRVKVETSKPFAINFSETYSPKWQAVINEERINAAPLYGFMNFYYIDKLGNYEFTLEYSDQKYLEIGKMITLISWVVIIILMIVLLLKR